MTYCQYNSLSLIRGEKEISYLYPLGKNRFVGIKNVSDVWQDGALREAYHDNSSLLPVAD